MTSVTELPYHFGITLRIYPNNDQQRFIKDCSNAQRFIYNQQVFYDHYISDMKRLYGLSRFYNDPMIQSWIQDVNRKKRKVTAIKKRFPFLKTNFDSLAGANAVQNHQYAWHQRRTLPHQFGFPAFHKKRDYQYDYRYNTNAQYHKNKDNEVVCSVAFDRRFRNLKLPKLKNIKIDHVRPLLKLKHDYRIGKVTVIKDALDHYHVSLQLASATPFKKPFPKTGKILAGDLNTDHFLVDQHFHITHGPRYGRTSLPKLQELQRQLSNLRRHLKTASKIAHDPTYQKLFYQFHKLSIKVHQHVPTKSS